MRVGRVTRERFFAVVEGRSFTRDRSDGDPAGSGEKKRGSIAPRAHARSRSTTLLCRARFARSRDLNDYCSAAGSVPRGKRYDLSQPEAELGLWTLTGCDSALSLARAKPTADSHSAPRFSPDAGYATTTPPSWLLVHAW